jgi:hypothetical protein
MSLSITHEGRVIFRQGAYSTVRVIPANAANPGAYGIASVIGEADDGAPGVAVIDNPDDAVTIFGPGDIEAAVRMLFSPSKDPDVPGGAYKVVVYKTNQSTKASTQLPADEVVLTDTAQGGTTETNVVFSKPLIASAHVGQHVRANGEVRAISANSGTACTVTAFTAPPSGTIEILDIIHNDTADTGATTTVIPLETGGLTVDAQIGRWVLISGLKRRIVDNAADSITVSPPLPSAPAQTTPVLILPSAVVHTSQRYGLAANQIGVEIEPAAAARKVISTVFSTRLKPDGSPQEETSDAILGSPALRLKYIGGGIPANGSGTISAVTATTISLDVASEPSSNAWVGMIFQAADGTQRLITANTNEDPSVITIDSAHALSAAEQAALLGQSAQVRNVTTAIASVVGGSSGGGVGKATALKTAVLPTADNLDITFATLGFTTLRHLIDHLNANTNYVASVGAGVNPDKVTLETLDFGGPFATSVDIRFDIGVEDQAVASDKFTVSYGGLTVTKRGRMYRDLQAYVDYVQGASALVTPARRTGTHAKEGGRVPAFTGGSSATVGDAAVFLVGAERGTSSAASWQAGFDELEKHRSIGVVPLITQDITDDSGDVLVSFAAVMNQLANHVIRRNGVAQNEARAYTGIDIAFPDSVVLSWAGFFNTRQGFVLAEEHEYPDHNGELSFWPAWSAAALALGMRCGTREIGDQLVEARINSTAVRRNSSWDPKNESDFNRLTAGGVMFSMADGGEIRWQRDRTSYVTVDANTSDIQTDGNLGEALNFMVYDSRTRMAKRFVRPGKGGRTKDPNRVAASPAAVRDFWVEILEGYRDAPYNLLSDSEDPADVNKAEGERRIVEGYDKVFVRAQSNTIRYGARVFLAPGVVFLIEDVAAGVASLAA